MNVLIIDDQKNVVNGLVKGIRWENIGIDQVWTANSSPDAKDILQREQIDIMLCDIEMPGEDGLSLFRWVTQYDSRIECIFLTAHADFEFAKEALRLGSFDYILQPAPYEEVEEAILKVCQRIKSKIQLQHYSSYGREFYRNKEIFLGELLKDWLWSNTIGFKEISEKLKKFQIYLNEETKVVYCIIQILSWTDENQVLESGLQKYVSYNILSELFDAYGIKVLDIKLEDYTYGYILYQADDNSIHKAEVRKRLELFLEKSRSFYGCMAACYLGDICHVKDLQNQVQEVGELQRNNVARHSGVFESSKNKEVQMCDLDWMKQWIPALVGGKAKEVKDQAFRYLEKKSLNAASLKAFYLEFMQVVSGACEQMNVSSYQIFEEKKDMEKMFHAYLSINSMKELVEQVISFFEKSFSAQDSNYVETVIQYIHCNIEKDIRRSDLALLVNLNEDYLSRIFKKEKGISLKEYIILEKMRTAQNLLKNTTFSISMIGMKVGFVNFSHFSQTYKKVMGKTPAEERM